MSRRFAGSLIGLDLDNTLICYDRLFLELALARGLLPTGFDGAKREIRDYVRSLPDGELEWQRLQAQAYGPAIAGANAASGALEFIREARRCGAELVIVSHKTLYSNLGSETVNLHDAARRWLRANSIVSRDTILETNVYFEESRRTKIARIIALGCTHFVDDLEEVLEDAAFPVNVERMLFASKAKNSRRAYSAYASFHEISDAFGD